MPFMFLTLLENEVTKQISFLIKVVFVIDHGYWLLQDKSTFSNTNQERFADYAHMH